MIFNKSEEEEKRYLKKVINIISNTINNTDISVKEHVDTLQEYKDYLWSNKDIDPHEIRSMRESIINHFAIGENVIDKRKRLGKLLDIPYFGRIDFKSNITGSSDIPIYIGIHSFYDSNSKINLIYDWRAPISGMFYDYELGTASYKSPAGEIQGKISLKRQYRIRKGIMEYMIENSLTIHDDILQKELSSNADDKMKNIVATIQHEQNRIIRNEDAQALIIQGVAGSGKTSIALHRIAYLLYTRKESISSNNILILSPNKVFADYISNVLPELGEENVPETSIEEILAGILDNKYRFQTFFEQVAELLEKPLPSFAERIRYKSTLDFITQLDKFILHIENTYFHPVDTKVNRYITIPAEYIEEQFKRFHRYKIRQRFEVMSDYIAQNLETRYRVSLSTAEKNRLQKEIRKMFAGNNDLQLYKDFFNWHGMPNMFKMRKHHTLEYSDIAPLAYLRLALEDCKSKNNVKHLLIDEMQDYSPIQYKILMKLFPCRKTILGDMSQSVNPYSSSTIEMIRKTLVTGEIMKLNKSYRSTYEITNFAQKIQENEELEPVARHGEKPQVVGFDNPEGEILGIADLISNFKKSNFKSLGIICKTESQAEEISEKINIYTDDVYFLSHQSSAFMKGIIITSAHMAKGLEFDEIIVPQSNNKNYCSEIDRSMLYIAVTRAMHKLSITYNGMVTELIKNNG